MGNSFEEMLKIIKNVENSNSYFDEDLLREFYNCFGDSIKIIVKYNTGNRHRISISEFYNLKDAYIESQFGVREVFLWSEDYRNLMKIKNMMLEF